MANMALYELCSKVYSGTATVDEMNEFVQIMQKIKDKGASPQAIWELNEIIIKQAQEIIAPRLDFLKYVADVHRVGHGEKIEYQKPKGKVKMKWTARGSAVDYTRIGFKTKFTAEPVKIAGGVYYEYDQLLSGSTEGFKNVVNLMVEAVENQTTEKVLQVLHTAMQTAPANNKWNGAGITLQNFDQVSSTVQRYNRKVTCVCDIDFAKKIARLVDASLMSDGMKNVLNTNGYFGTVNSVDIVVFNNPWEDTSNTKLVAPRQFAYILPAGADKPVKIGFEGGLYQLTEQDMDTERVFLKAGQKISVDMFDSYYTGELNDTTLA